MIRTGTPFVCVALTILALACASGSKDSKGGPREAKTREAKIAKPRPWPTSFSESSMLFAQTIEVTGPKGLLEHVAIQQDAENHTHVESVTKDGMRIEETQKPETPEAERVPIRAHLDNLQLYADGRLIVLESPSATHVVVQATGDVFFRSEKTGEEKRLPTLRLVGAH